MIRGARVSNMGAIFAACLAVESPKVHGEFMSVRLIVRFSAR